MINKKIFMTVALLCALAQGAWAENVTFNVRYWDATNKQVVTTPTTKDATVLTSYNDWVPLGANDDLDDHYYVVKGNVSIKTLNCFGRVHLILADNATLTCTGGIIVQEKNSTQLFIYSQSNGENEGKLIVTNSNKASAGIGSQQGENNGTIEIHGGNLDVKGGEYAAGIGAGACMSTLDRRTKAGKITIFGGIVKAEGDYYSAGIGGGAGIRDIGTGVQTYSDGAEFYLYDGQVTATGGKYGAGVGGGGGGWCNSLFGRGGGSGNCNIYGGKLTAQGGIGAAGIGGGVTIPEIDNNGEIHISGGTVNATGGTSGAGIGGGVDGGGGSIHISDGNVTAKGGVNAAGIGGGLRSYGGTINISGGNVRAEGGSRGAGIGSGKGGEKNKFKSGAYVTINGGTVIAIAGEECNARESKGGSAIGCGMEVDNKDADYVALLLTFADHLRVTAGDAEDNIERVFSTDLRVPACRWRNYVKIEACGHTTPTVGSDQAEAKSYTIDGDQHTMHCRYCAYTLQENHTFVGDVCNACGKRDNTSDDLWSVTLHRASAATSISYADRVVMKVVKGQTFTLPAVSATEGLTLMGYATAWTENMGIEMKDGETLTEVGTVVTPEADMHYYPRYRYRYVPTWTWNDDDATATLSITCSALSSEAVNVGDISYTTRGDVKTATGTYDHYGATYTFTYNYLLPMGELVLRDASSNKDNLHDYDGRKVSTLWLQGRTLYADGSWNTLCLPFSLTTSEVTSQLAPSELKTLSSTDFNNETGMLTLNFIDATAIEAGKPYIIKWTSGSGDRTNPSFRNVIIENVDKSVATDDVTFAGFFSPVSLDANDKSVLYLGAGNTLYYPSADMTVNACRAVFALNGLTAGELPETGQAPARAFVLNFGEDDNTTGIVSTTDYTDFTDQDDTWYDLSGRKLNGQPNKKGIYINDGKKVVIK